MRTVHWIQFGTKKVRFQNFYFGLSIINNVLLYEYIYIYTGNCHNSTIQVNYV